MNNNKFSFDFSDCKINGVVARPHHHYILMGEDTELEVLISVARIPDTECSIMMTAENRYGRKEDTTIEVVSNTTGVSVLNISLDPKEFGAIYAGYNDPSCHYLDSIAEDKVSQISLKISEKTGGVYYDIVDILENIIRYNTSTPLEYGTEKEYIEYTLNN